MRDFFIIGGGISGLSALEELIRILVDEEDETTAESQQHTRITLLHSGSLLSRVSTSVQHTEAFSEVTLIERVDAEVYITSLRQQVKDHSSEEKANRIEIRQIEGELIKLDAKNHRVTYRPTSTSTAATSITSSTTATTAAAEAELAYTRVCICTGASPTNFLCASAESSASASSSSSAASSSSSSSPSLSSSRILTIRDATSISHLASALSTPIAGTTRPKRVAIIGNGGIALELVHALRTGQLNTLNTYDQVASANGEEAKADAGSMTDEPAAATSSNSSTAAPAASSSPTFSFPPLLLDWLIPHTYVGSTFLDRMSSAFLLPLLFPEDDQQITQGKEKEEKEQEQEQDEGDKKRRHQPAKYINNCTVSTPASSTPASTAATSSSSISATIGPALGPNWLNQLYLDTNIPKYILEKDRLRLKEGNEADMSEMKQLERKSQKQQHDLVSLNLQMSTSVLSVTESTPPSPSEYPLTLTLSTGATLSCDLLLSAVGVTPNTSGWCPPELKQAEEDGAIQIDEWMKTSVEDVYAAGDCAKLVWRKKEGDGSDTTMTSSDAPSASSSSLLPSSLTTPPPLFHTSRLWSHAKLLGTYAARSMSGVYDQELTDLEGFNFMLFTHTTLLFGKKTILLGQYNLQGYTKQQIKDLRHSGALRTLVRCKPPGQEFIKVHLLNNCIIGVLLLGDEETLDLEETFENLMLNQADMERYGDFLNDVDVDLADYFD